MVWYQGTVLAYDRHTGKFGIAYDNEDVFIFPLLEDLNSGDSQIFIFIMIVYFLLIKIKWRFMEVYTAPREEPHEEHCEEPEPEMGYIEPCHGT